MASHGTQCIPEQQGPPQLARAVLPMEGPPRSTAKWNEPLRSASGEQGRSTARTGEASSPASRRQGDQLVVGFFGGIEHQPLGITMPWRHTARWACMMVALSGSSEGVESDQLHPCAASRSMVSGATVESSLSQAPCGARISAEQHPRRAIGEPRGDLLGPDRATHTDQVDHPAAPR